ncbi:hypothetical protein Tco_1540505 [Tanacetum coccineum]
MQEFKLLVIDKRVMRLLKLKPIWNSRNGDRIAVLLKVSPWKGLVRFGKWGKLNPRYVGPFKVLEKVGSVAYKLKLPQELNIVMSDSEDSTVTYTKRSLHFYRLSHSELDDIEKVVVCSSLRLLKTKNALLSLDP